MNAVIIFAVLVVIAAVVYFLSRKKSKTITPLPPSNTNSSNGDVDVSGIQQMLLASGGAATKYTGTVTVAYDTDSATYEQYLFVSGAFGSASPTTLTDGKTFFELQTYFSPLGAFQYNYLDISGFSSDPGSSYLTSIKISGTTYTLSPLNYVYSSGHATWQVATTAWLNSASAYAVELKG